MLLSKANASRQHDEHSVACKAKAAFLIINRAHDISLQNAMRIVTYIACRPVL